MLLTGVFLTLLWEQPFLFPVKSFSVLIHEMWHGLASIAAGANLEQVVLYNDESGETMVSRLNQHWQFIVSVSAGYLGTTFTGAVLLNRSLLGKGEKITFGFFAAILLYMSILFTKPMSSAFYVGMSASTLFLFLLVLKREVVSMTMLLLGTLLVWYSLFDTLDFTTQVTRTDAGILASYLINRNILFPASASVEFAANLISIVWSFILFLELFLFMKPVWSASPAVSIPAFDSEQVEPDPDSQKVVDSELPEGMDANELLQLQALVQELGMLKPETGSESGPETK